MEREPSWTPEVIPLTADNPNVELDEEWFDE
jgi:hypothetical protein